MFYVYRGDCILLEWESEDGVTQIGIIDAGIIEKGQICPAISYLKNLKTSFRIRFLIWSHPHIDHYEGYHNLLEYLEQNNLRVDLFFKTYESKKLWEAISSYGTKSYTAPVPLNLVGLYHRIINLTRLNRKKTPLLQEIRMNASGQYLKLNPNLSLHILAPHFEDQYLSIRKIYDPVISNTQKKDSGIQNKLSSIIQLCLGTEGYCLFTSDAEKNAFNHILQICQQSKKPLVWVQVPHHGSKDNFLSSFWQKVTKQSQTFAVVSCGSYHTNQYNHPCHTSLKQISDSGYRIEQTFFDRILSASELATFKAQQSTALKQASDLDSTGSSLEKEHFPPPMNFAKKMDLHFSFDINPNTKKIGIALNKKPVA